MKKKIADLFMFVNFPFAFFIIAIGFAYSWSCWWFKVGDNLFLKFATKMINWHEGK